MTTEDELKFIHQHWTSVELSTLLHKFEEGILESRRYDVETITFLHMEKEKKFQVSSW